MFLSFSFQDESRETKKYPATRKSRSLRKRISKTKIKKRVKYFSPLKKKKKNETKRTSRIKSGRFRLIFSRRRMEWRLTPGTRLSRENPHAASISDWIFPISNLGFSREKPTSSILFFFFFFTRTNDQKITVKKDLVGEDREKGWKRRKRRRVTDGRSELEDRGDGRSATRGRF